MPTSSFSASSRRWWWMWCGKSDLASRTGAGSQGQVEGSRGNRQSRGRARCRHHLSLRQAAGGGGCGAGNPISHPERARALKDKLKVHAGIDNLEAVRDADIIFLCVKPQVVVDVVREIRSRIPNGRGLSRTS